MTQEQIRQLAIDISENRVFTSTMLRANDRGAVHSVFMPLAFMGKTDLNKLVRVNAVLYEYMDKAMPRSVNGYPTFMSFKFMSDKDWKKVQKLLEKLQKFKEELK